MDRPPPPEAVLVRLVRQAAKIPIAAAAKRAGMSTARWTQVEQGYETRAGRRRPATAPADTLAYMAAAIGLSPDRLEAEGQRPDAAAVLREMQRHSGPLAASENDNPWLSFTDEEKRIARDFIETLRRSAARQARRERDSA